MDPPATPRPRGRPCTHTSCQMGTEASRRCTQECGWAGTRVTIHMEMQPDLVGPGPRDTVANTQAATQLLGEVYPPVPGATLGVVCSRPLDTPAATRALAHLQGTEDILNWASTRCRGDRFQARVTAQGTRLRRSTTSHRRLGAREADPMTLTVGLEHQRAAAAAVLGRVQATTARAAGPSHPLQIRGARGVTQTLGRLRGTPRLRSRATTGPGATGAATGMGALQVPVPGTRLWASAATMMTGLRE